MRDGKKSKFEVLIKDLALSCVYGTTKYDRTNENKTNTFVPPNIGPLQGRICNKVGGSYNP